MQTQRHFICRCFLFVCGVENSKTFSGFVAVNWKASLTTRNETHTIMSLMLASDCYSLL